MVCSGSAGVGALAVLGEHPDAPQWVRLVRNRIRAWLLDRGGDWYVDNPFVPGRPDPIPVIGPSEPNFGVDGGYKETIGYMDYAMRYVLYFADALRRETGENLATHIPANLLEPLAWNVLNWPVDGGVWTAMIDFGDTGPSPRFPEVFAGLTRHRNDGRAAWLYRNIIPSPNILRALLWLDPTVPARPPS